MLAKVLSLRALSSDCYELWASAALREPMPGRFVHIAIPGSVLRRPISLCGVEGDTLRLVFAVKGEGTRWLSARRPGDSLDLLGALGNGFPKPEGGTLLVGGGVGLPPLLYYASRHPDNCHALAGFRSKDAVILAGEFPSLDLFTDDGSAGTKGYPTDALPALLASGRFQCVLACGPLPLLQNTKRISREAGIDCFVSLEERMACGVGTCMVCVCAVRGTHKRVCCDGPVFLAEEVDLL